jgi:homopolymeric O-antigen transport system permease protein
MDGNQDIFRSLRKTEIWLDLGAQDFMDQYSRAHLGPLWSLLQPLAWISAIVIFFGPLMSDDLGSYTLYVGIGITIYNFLNGAVVECGNAFVNQRGLIQNFPLPLFVHILRETTKNICKLLAQLLVIFAIFLLFENRLTLYALWAIPALALTILSFLNVSLIVSIVTAKSGDVLFGLVSIMRLVFFATPIIWFAEGAEGLRKALIQINPFAQFIDIVRKPLLGLEVSLYTQTYVLIFFIASMTIALLLFNAFRPKIIMWVQT